MKRFKNITSQMAVGAIILVLISTKTYGWFSNRAQTEVMYDEVYEYEMAKEAEGFNYAESFDYAESIEGMPILAENFDINLFGDKEEYKKYFYIEEQAEYMEIMVDIWGGSGSIKLCDDSGNELKEWKGVSNGANQFIYDFNKAGIDTKRENFYIEVENESEDVDEPFSGNISYYIYKDYAEVTIVEESRDAMG